MPEEYRKAKTPEEKIDNVERRVRSLEDSRKSHKDKIATLENLVLKDDRYLVVETIVLNMVKGRNKAKDFIFKTMVGISIFLGGGFSLWVIMTLVEAIISR